MSDDVSSDSDDGARAGVSSFSETLSRVTLKRIAAKISRDRVSLSAGSLAYHWFLALFPAVIAALGCLAISHIDARGVASLTHAIEKALPPGVATVFTSAVTAARTRESGSVLAVVLGVLIALWSASGGMSALQQALDVAYEVPVDRKFLARRVRAIPLMAATVLLGGSGAVLVVLGAPLGSGIEGHLPVHGLAFTVAWTSLRWALTLAAVSTLFSIFYYSGPNKRKPTWQWVSAGGALATGVFVLASLAFSFYVTNFGSYDRTYGTFAGVAILIFWLYLTGMAVLVGGEINAELERETSSENVHDGSR
jgi:membrane protein